MNMKENVVATGTDPESESMDETEVLSQDGNDVKPKAPKFIKAAQKAIESGAEAVGKVGNQFAAKTEELFRNKNLMKRQMLFYGVIHLYNDGLEKFMNL